MYETTSISARIRDEVRPWLEAEGFTVHKKRGMGSNAYVYWIGKK